MGAKRVWRRAALAGAVGFALTGATGPRAGALPLTWVGGNNVWVDGEGDANWAPPVEPGFADEAIFNTPNTVNMESRNEVGRLTLGGGVRLNTNGYNLPVGDLAQLAGPGTKLIIGPDSIVTVGRLSVNLGSVVELAGGHLRLDNESDQAEMLVINPGGELGGYGRILIEPLSVGPPYNIKLNNIGKISAARAPSTPGGDPAPGTLWIDAFSSGAEIDLDGSLESGVVDVRHNQTLQVDVRLSDAFNGDMNLFHGSRLAFGNPWPLAGGRIDVDTGAVSGTPAGVATISGEQLTQTGGTIRVIDGDGGLEFWAPFQMHGGTLENNGVVAFSGDAHILPLANFTMPSERSSLTVFGHLRVDQANFNADGDGTDTNVISIGNQATLELNLGAGSDQTLSGVIIISGTLDVDTTDNAWTIDGAVNTVGAGQIRGDPVTLTSAAVSGNGRLTIEAPLVFGAGSSYTGNGQLIIASESLVSADTTIGVHLFDWDGARAAHTHLINNGVRMRIDSAVMDRVEDNTIELGGNNGTLTVDGPASWEMGGTLRTNPSNVGTSFINGGSRLMLVDGGRFQVVGDTNVDSPVRFILGSNVDIAAGAVLNLHGDAIYDGAFFTGSGLFNPSTALNTVTRASAINNVSMGLDRGDWVVDSVLKLIIGDYDAESVNRFNGSAITLDGGVVDINTSDAEFVMDGTLNLNNIGGWMASWEGEPLDVGNDAGALSARVNVGGNGASRIISQVDFNADVDVRIAAGATLSLTNMVVFNTVNGAMNASFTGVGTLSFDGAVNVNEAVTLNMVGGTVDLDGTDTAGDRITINAPLVINAATMADFGRDTGVGATHTLDVDNNAANGSLTVNLDSPTAEWTLNPHGQLNLFNTTGGVTTLLAGSPVNLNGTVNTGGPVGIAARVDIGGTVNMLLSGSSLVLSGGSASVLNTLEGGTINGPGVLAATAQRGLAGFGTIDADIDFEGDAVLVAQGGLLEVNGTILDVGTLRTSGAAAVLDLGAPLDTSVTDSGILMEQGTLRGAAITVASAIAPLRGRGTVNNAVIYSGRTDAVGGLLVLAGDTTINDGALMVAPSGSALRLTGATSATGTFSKGGNGTLAFNGPQNHGPLAELRIDAGTVNLNTPAGTLASHHLFISARDGSLNMNTSQHLRGLEIAGRADAILTADGGRVLRTERLSIAGPTKLDLTDNKLIVVAGDVEAVAAMVGSGYDGGAWDGPGIVTSASSSSTGLGVARADEVGLAGGTFGGVPVAARDVLVRFTLYGDADLDGAVDFDDLARLAQNYNSSGKRWPHADFNYDGLVNFDDLARMAQNYNQALPAGGIAGAAPGFAADWAAAIAAVPEPGASAMIALSMPWVMRRRRCGR